MIVENQKELEELCRELSSRGTFALDTEFVRERTFFIQLGIIQVAAEGIVAVLDPLPLPSLQPLFELIANPAIEKIVHAGEQDFAALVEKGGPAPRNVFDTQVAAALVGYGDQVSYARLVAKVTGVQLSKLETLTNWTARPLTEAQIHYSLDDVRYLPELRRHLGERLSKLGRSGWEREECKRLENEETYRLPSPRAYYLKLTKAGLNGTTLGVLREVAAWREETARSRNVPRGWVLRDQSVLEIARRKPDSVKSLGHIRSLKPQQIRKDGAAILEAVKLGGENPLSEKREEEPRFKAPLGVESLARLVEAWLYERALATEMAPGMLATRGDLRSLVTSHHHGHLPELPLLEGWRRELVGQDLLDILDGRKALRVNKHGRVEALEIPRDKN
ncbi:MAG TPA: ribonuclease D [Vicinamibacteria bacterium]|nr:ribonuclease D [Vicinamibacteria bacterium]